MQPASKSQLAPRLQDHADYLKTRALVLMGETIEGVDFDAGVDLSRATAIGCTFVRCRFGARMVRARFQHCVFTECTFVDGERVEILDSEIRVCRFAAANMRDCTITRSEMVDCDLTEACFAGADLRDTPLTFCVLAGCNLWEAAFDPRQCLECEPPAALERVGLAHEARIDLKPPYVFEPPPADEGDGLADLEAAKAPPSLTLR